MLAPTRPGNPALVLTVCCASIVLVVMDISVVNVALPTIQHDLDASVSGLQWTLDAYTLVLASFLVLAGASADRFGRRRVFIVGLTTFGLGSVLCGLAPSIGWLVAARVVQGAGGTMLNPVAMAIIATTYVDPAARARAIGVFGSMSGLALALGPMVGGLLVDAFGWRSIFWVNLPVAAAALLGTLRFVPESRAPRARRPDPVGQLLVVLLLGGVVVGLIESRERGWTAPVVLVLFALAALAAAALLVWEPRRADPLLELRLFRSGPFSGAIVMAVVALCAFGAFLFVTTRYLQDTRGLSPVGAGLTLLPLGLVVLLVAPSAGRVVGHRGPRLPLVVAGAALSLAGMVQLAVAPGSPLALLLVLFALVGLFLGAVNPPMTATAVAGMPGSMAGVAAALVSSGRQTGTALGVAIAGSAAGSLGWLVLVAGAVLLALALLSTGTRARASADRAAALFGPAQAP